METMNPSSGELERIRAAIDELDERLVRLIADRLGLASEAGRLKERAGLPSSDPEREARIVRRVAELARTLELEPELVRTIFWRILSLSHRERERRGGSREG